MKDRSSAEDNLNTTKIHRFRKSKYFAPFVICFAVWKIASTYYWVNYIHKLWDEFSAPGYSRVLIECRENLRETLGNNYVSRANISLDNIDLD